MSKNFNFIPVEDRPYFWAYEEMHTFFPDPHRIRLSLDHPVIEPDCHVSLFHTGDTAYPDIYRVYWHSSDSVSYQIVTNFAELRKKHPELVELLLNCGAAAYEAVWSMKMEQRMQTGETGDIPNYSQMIPIKPADEE